MNLNKFVCFHCNKILKQPMQLEMCSCDNKQNICKEHKNIDSFACPKCQHVFNRSLENEALRNEIEKFVYLNDQEMGIKVNVEKVFEELENLILSFNAKIDEFSLTQADHFETIRRDIDIRRESLIQELVNQSSHEKINELNRKSEEMIEKVEKCEKEFRQNFDQEIKPNLIGFNLNEAQNDFNELLRETENLVAKLNSKLEFYELKLKEIKQRFDNFKLYEYDLEKCQLIIPKNVSDMDLGELNLSHTFFKEQEEIFNAIINNPYNEDEDEIIFLNFNTGHIIQSLSKDKKEFNRKRLSLSEDASKLVSSGQQGFPKVWNLFTGECLFELEESQIWYVKCLADNRVATCSINGLQIWDLSSGKLLLSNDYDRVQTHQYVESGLHILEQAVNDPNTIIIGYGFEFFYGSGGPSWRQLHIWDLITNKICYAIKLDGGSIRNEWLIKSVNNNLVAYPDSSKIDIWNYRTCKCVGYLGCTRSNRDLEYLKNENRLISCSDDGTILIWCMSTFELVQKINCETRVDKFELIANSNPQKFLIKENSKCFHLWDLTTNKCLYTFNFYFEIKKFYILFNKG